MLDDVNLSSLTFDSPSDVINKYNINEDIYYSIKSQKPLMSFAGTQDYTIYELSPYGYAILLNSTNGLLEACYSKNAIIPVDMSSTTTYFYGGPGIYCVQENGSFVNLYDGATLDKEMIAELNLLHTSITAYETQKATTLSRNISSTYNTTSATDNSSTQTHPVEYNYFSGLTKYGNNRNGTCTVIATAMLLGYYDNYANDLVVGSSYENGDGTTEAFHQLLNSYVYENTTQGGIYIHKAAAGINNYLSTQSLNCSLESLYVSEQAQITQEDVINRIISKLQSGTPVIASMKKSLGASYNHTVLVYCVTYDSSNPSDTAMLTMNMGWKSGIEYGQSLTEFVASAGWFYECGYITSTCAGHVFTTWSEVDSTYHRRSCQHCILVEKGFHSESWNSILSRCNRCGRTGFYGVIL